MPADLWCPATTPPVPVYYCDAAGRGNCDLQCAAAIWECTDAIKDNGMCRCKKDGVRTVLRYNGPLGLSNPMP